MIPLEKNFVLCICNILLQLNNSNEALPNNSPKKRVKTNVLKIQTREGHEKGRNGQQKETECEYNESAVQRTSESNRTTLEINRISEHQEVIEQ